MVVPPRRKGRVSQPSGVSAFAMWSTLDLAMI
jgi:hypothetical protein